MHTSKESIHKESFHTSVGIVQKLLLTLHTLFVLQHFLKTSYQFISTKKKYVFIYYLTTESACAVFLFCDVAS